MIADIILIAIMALCIFLGYKKGLIGVAVKILSLVLSIVVALVLYSPISNYIINNTEIVNNLEATIEEKLEDDEETASSLEQYITEYKNEGIEYTSNIVATSIVRIAVWIGIFILVRVIMIFVKVFAGIVEKIPLIKQFNKVRWSNLWLSRRSFNNICSACNSKFDFTNVRLKWANSND